MSTTQAIPQEKNKATQGELYMSFELGDKSWKLTASDGRRGPSRYSAQAGDTAAVLDCIRRARERCELEPQARVHSCYEAGRDGWWLHRWLGQQGIDNLVVDAASIEVNRRARRAKTDRLDGDRLLAMLRRHHAGERGWSVLHEPTPEQEDARRVHRELARLTQERIAHTNRIGSLLVLHNLRVSVTVGGRDWAYWWERHREQVPPVLRGEIERESARLALVRQQLNELHGVQRQEVVQGKQPLVAQLARLRAIGTKGAWVLVKEVFGWRRFANRRELAGCLGLAPTPYNSGDSQIEQGISKAGNKRARTMLVELAWRWLRLQPDSLMTLWFNRRFAGSGKRMRRVGILALARRLAIALWRYLEHGEIPAGASLKAVSA
ncbi:IS110 family transposase [Paraburkholderia sp. BL10I2N1]|uniref:IS110 family transposase n=1 Tax=Paraburkholderia sp. BL10I2N1 TaxID=1938796 RepID=UPI00105B6C66|nr:IS110 family transposase [Paraburkholderia sp. BL10I2N1]TDN58712.1 transposase [Paraburkholderia sp. BL10I2N1]